MLHFNYLELGFISPLIALGKKVDSIYIMRARDVILEEKISIGKSLHWYIFKIHALFESSGLTQFFQDQMYLELLMSAGSMD